MHTSMKIGENTINRIKFITDGTETPSQFVKKATFERLKRMEARDDRSVRQSDEKLEKMIKKIVMEVSKETIMELIDHGVLKHG